MLVTWGAIYWLPDVRAWARVVANFLRPEGLFYMAEGHPSALVFDDAAPGLEDRPGWFAPYFQTGPIAIDELEDYANREAALKHVRSYSWMHPLSRRSFAMDSHCAPRTRRARPHAGRGGQLAASGREKQANQTTGPPRP